MVFLIFMNLNKFNDVLSLFSAFISLIILIILPIASLMTIRRLKNIDVTKNSYQKTLLIYTKAKQRLCQVQKFGLYLSGVLMFSIIPVFASIMEKELKTSSILGSLPFGIVFLVIFIIFVWRYYSKSIQETQAIIKDLEQ